ncbi:MAG: hypothetical protein A3I15_04315 [Chlamydiae bacterium RIFCSPLOWO2_02_FULL_49_12]|nr:MAG: hypothetical protein A3I15_04315 [Chlamydiae bacterium RIFCSPLOWO2_02_FULL_49_12]
MVCTTSVSQGAFSCWDTFCSWAEMPSSVRKLAGVVTEVFDWCVHLGALSLQTSPYARIYFVCRDFRNFFDMADIFPSLNTCSCSLQRLMSGWSALVEQGKAVACLRDLLEALMDIWSSSEVMLETFWTTMSQPAARLLERIGRPAFIMGCLCALWKEREEISHLTHALASDADLQVKEALAAKRQAELFGCAYKISSLVGAVLGALTFFLGVFVPASLPLLFSSTALTLSLATDFYVKRAVAPLFEELSFLQLSSITNQYRLELPRDQKKSLQKMEQEIARGALVVP